MTGLFEEAVELVREDGVRLRALRVLPDDDAAENCHGAGVVVTATTREASEAVLERIVRGLARAGYVVVAVALAAADDAGAADGHGGAFADPIDDLQAAIASVREMARGRTGVLALGATGPIALAAAALLPQLDAVVHAGGGPPAPAARLGRVRAAVLLHQAAAGTALTDADVAALTARLQRARAPLTIRRHDAADGFFTGDSAEAEVAFDQTRDFFALSLT